MSAFDFSPLYRSGIGFERIIDLLEDANRLQAVDSWPPYDIARTGEDAYSITMAVAGFDEGELTVTQEQNVLVIGGSKASQEQHEYLHRGIAERAFQRRFQLADHVRVTEARLNNGLLTIELVREIPEEKRPRRIAITGQAFGQKQPRQIEGQKAA